MDFPGKKISENFSHAKNIFWIFLRQQLSPGTFHQCAPCAPAIVPGPLAQFHVSVRQKNSHVRPSKQPFLWFPAPQAQHEIALPKAPKETFFGARPPPTPAKRGAI